MSRVYCFQAMNAPCEVHVDGASEEATQRLGQIIESEARRIEAKYSRYRHDSLLSLVNASNGHPVTVDSEMLALLSYAQQCYVLSNGLFDITSGVLRKVWTFDGSDNVPSAAAINRVKSLVGFNKITIDIESSSVTLPCSMEIDFGGLAKEYAVDRSLMLANQITDLPVLVNFGGDLAVSGPRQDGQAWMIAIDNVFNELSAPNIGNVTDNNSGALALHYGAITTSGDAARFLKKDGVRYSHILNPHTGWPIDKAPRSVTVAAASCMAAGMMSTMAILAGIDAEKFIQTEALQAWIYR